MNVISAYTMMFDMWYLPTLRFVTARQTVHKLLCIPTYVLTLFSGIMSCRKIRLGQTRSKAPKTSYLNFDIHSISDMPLIDAVPKQITFIDSE